MMKITLMTTTTMIKIKTICQVRHPRDSQLRGRDGGDGQPCRPGKCWDLWRRGDSMNLWMWRCFNNDFGSKVSVEVEVWDGPPGPRWCHCMRGPLTPDADSCDLWPWILHQYIFNWKMNPWTKVVTLHEGSHPEFVLFVCQLWEPETSDIVNATCTALKPVAVYQEWPTTTTGSGHHYH